MSRIIKFRAWHTVHQVMYDHKSIPVLLKNVADDQVWKYMQFTGFNDSAGVEIYEGDIVDMLPGGNDKIWLRQIIWDHGAFIVKQIHGPASFPMHFGKNTPDREWIVVGNIYRNPEMLKLTA